MKNSLFFLLITLFVLSCGKELTEESLEGLWYDENNQEQLYFHEDSICFGFGTGWSHSLKYQINSREAITTLGNDEIQQEYFVNQDTISSKSYVTDFGTIAYEERYVKIPFSSVLEYKLAEMEISIDFVEGKTAPLPFMTKGHYYSFDYYVGNSVEDPAKKILIHNDKRYALKHLDKINLGNFFTKHYNDVIDRTKHFLFLDKNLTFEEYSKIRIFLHRSGLYFKKIHFIILDKPAKTLLPENLKQFYHFPALIKLTEQEYAQSNTPLPPYYSLEKAIENGLKTTNISWSKNSQITLEGNPISKNDLYLEMKKRYLEYPQNMSFVYSPHPESKLETYLVLRNTLYGIRENLLQEYAKEHYEKDFDSLDYDIRKKIRFKFYIFEHLIY